MDSTCKKIPFIDHHFQTSSIDTCTRILAPALFPDWAPTNSNLEITKLTEGTTNSASHVSDPYSSHRSRDVDASVLIKVYGSGTDITIDREKELSFHCVLAEHKLAPAPLVRFSNGHAYPFVDGRICSLEELPQKEIGYCVAQEIANWHGYLPKLDPRSPKIQFESVLPSDLLIQPNVWITAQKWLNSIPEASEAEKVTKENLTEEFTYLLQRLHGGGGQEMVFTHGDLLHANIVITDSSKSNGLSVSFIDYEHSTFAPPAFELANHFSEWAGFACNYESLPSRDPRMS
ncbi:hypothetical protein HYALB_00010119 [Hymenoscyphus albidus]|uniref:ethanolamine kinase n=1 Tax=Hymenoscyphus albidus TaxID=595503 RepID=A0A9N9Q0Z3_9HELO|nr:hypothetical protein HYALB_00010119 [Hymenoscyphus albidus]